MELLDEGCLVVDDPGPAAGLERRWAEDLSRSRQVVGARPPLGDAAPGRGQARSRRGPSAEPTFGT